MNDSDILRTMAKVVIEIDAAPVVVGGTVVGVVVGPSVGSVGSVGIVVGIVVGVGSGF